MAYFENGAGGLETRAWSGELGIEFQNSDKFILNYGGNYEFLVEPFRIASGITLPVGAYDFSSVVAGYNFFTRRKGSGNLSVEYGTFYSGHRKTIGLSRGRVALSSQLSVEPTASINWVDLAQGSFISRLVGSRVTYTVTPLMFVSALFQYSSDSNSVASNVRLRWEYHPGSELFVVYNEQRDTRAVRFPALANRALVVKINRLFRF
jgi:hypothetical protein